MVFEQKNTQKRPKFPISPFSAGSTGHTQIRKISKSPKSCSFEPKVMGKCLKNIFKVLRDVEQKKYAVKWGYSGGGVLETLICQYPDSPPPHGQNRRYMHLKQYIGPSDSKTTPNDPISYTMIVYGRLDPFLAISKNFESYHGLASPGKLDKCPKLALFVIFLPQLHFWKSQNRVKKCL